MFYNYFKATKSKVIGNKDYRLFRKDGYTANGYWLMLSIYEPDFIKELKSTTLSKDAPKGMKKIVGQNFPDANFLLRPSGNFRIFGKDPAIELETEEKNEAGFPLIVSWMNAFYYSLFMNLKTPTGRNYRVDFYTRRTIEGNNPIVIKNDENFVGLVMPIRSV